MESKYTWNHVSCSIFSLIIRAWVVHGITCEWYFCLKARLFFWWLINRWSHMQVKCNYIIYLFTKNCRIIKLKYARWLLKAGNSGFGALSWNVCSSLWSRQISRKLSPAIAEGNAVDCRSRELHQNIIGLSASYSSGRKQLLAGTVCSPHDKKIHIPPAF